MDKLMRDKKQRFFAFRPAFQVGVTLLLILLGLGALGQWYLIFILFGMTIFFSISVLVFSTMIHMNRNSGSDDNHLPFLYLPIYRMFYSMVDPRPSRLEQE